MYGEGAGTRIGSFLSSFPLGVSRGREKNEKKDNKGEGITEGKRRDAAGLAHVCVYETGNGYGPEWTDGQRDGRGVKAVRGRVRREEGRRQGFEPLRRNHRA